MACSGRNCGALLRKKATSVAAEASRVVASRGRNSVGFRHKAHHIPIYMMVRYSDFASQRKMDRREAWKQTVRELCFGNDSSDEEDNLFLATVTPSMSRRQHSAELGAVQCWDIGVSSRIGWRAIKGCSTTTSPIPLCTSITYSVAGNIVNRKSLGEVL